MNKTQLIDLIASKCDVSKRQASDVLNCIIEGVTDSVVAGKEVSLPGLGKFFAKATAARKGRNPSTGEEIKIAASKRVSFRAAKPFKDAVKATA